MKDTFELIDTYSESAVIKVIGIGGGGNNAVSHMAGNNIEASVLVMKAFNAALFVALVLMLWQRSGGLYGTTELPSAPSR